MHELLKNSFNIPLSTKGRCLSMLKSGPTKKRKRPASRPKLTLEVRLDRAPTLPGMQAEGIKKRKLNPEGEKSLSTLIRSEGSH
mmetsp:Transcript_17920/g.12905  ORF Transcript_17920/g.12905 Transcript_17920/m.12905 type:complete len:84 (-) Transcript_17920:26-277(-)